MKKLFSYFFLLIGLLVLVSCSNPNSSEKHDNITFSEGWWKWKTDYTTMYFYYDADKNIVRAGTDTQEYTDSILNNVKTANTWKWDTCAYAASQSSATFKKITDGLPEWANDIEPDDILPDNIIVPLESRITAVESQYLFDSTKATKIYFDSPAAIEDNDFVTIELEDGKRYVYSDTIHIFDCTSEYFTILVTDAIKNTSFTYRIYNSTKGIFSNYGTIIVDKANPDDNPSNSLYNPLLIGTWYCSDDVLFKYLQFSNNGTGKSFISYPDNYSTFNWKTENGKLVLSGNMWGTTDYSIIGNTLILNDYCGLKNITFRKM